MTEPVAKEESKGDGKEEEIIHIFTEAELDKMMYYWDKSAYPVVEYTNFKDEWLNTVSNATQDSPTATKDQKILPESQNGDGHRKRVDLGNGAENATATYLNLNTYEEVQIIEFYAPWCPRKYFHHLSLPRTCKMKCFGLLSGVLTNKPLNYFWSRLSAI
jgi:hypothetical protein